MPHKRHERAVVTFLERPELEPILAMLDQATQIGRRDHALLLLAAQTGLRQSELTGLRCQDIQLVRTPRSRAMARAARNAARRSCGRRSAFSEPGWLNAAGHRGICCSQSRHGGRLSPGAFGRLLHN